MPYGTPRDRYFNDPTFAKYVDILRAVISQSQMSPSEMREGLMVAVCMEEARRPGPTVLRMEEFARDVIEDQKGRR